MVETAAGHRVLLAPHQEAADFISATYSFDEMRIEPFAVGRPAPGRSVAVAAARPDRRRVVRRWAWRSAACRAGVAESPAWCTLTDPVARVVLRGVRTRGTAGGDASRVVRRHRHPSRDRDDAGRFDGVDLGELADVDPPCRFGFSSTPKRPSVTDGRDDRGAG